MKIRGSTKSIAPLLAATLVAGAATTYSPISCGCIDAWQGVAFRAGHKNLQDSHALTPRLLADGLAKQLTGKKVWADEMPSAMSTYDCAQAYSPERTVRCRWWLWKNANSNGIDYKGYDVVITTDSNDYFKKVLVIPIAHKDHQ